MAGILEQIKVGHCSRSLIYNFEWINFKMAESHVTIIIVMVTGHASHSSLALVHEKLMLRTE